MKRYLPPSFFCSDAGTTDFTTQFWRHAPGFQITTSTAATFAEMRIVLSGEEVFCAVHVDKLEGNDIRKKSASLGKMTKDNFHTLITTTQADGDVLPGWIAKVGPGSLIAIPAGYLFLHFAKAEAIGIRWSVWDKTRDFDMVSKVMKLYLKIWPSLKTAAYATAVKFLADFENESEEGLDCD